MQIVQYPENYFFFEDKENNKYIYLKRRSSITSNECSIPRVSINNINDITITDIENKDDNNKKKKDINTMPVIFTQKAFNNFIISSDKTLNREEIKIPKKRKKTKERKEIEENKKKNPFSILDIFKISIFTCCENKLNYKERLIKEAMDIFDKKLDIYIYIKNMILIDIMYQILMSDINKDCVNFLSRSLIYLNKKKKEEVEELNEVYMPTSKLKSYNSEKLYREFTKLVEKTEKTEIEKKIVSLYNDD